MHLTHGHYARSWGYRILAMYQMRKSEEPLVVHRSHLVTNRHLRLFGHITRSSPREDHHRALAACIRQVLPDWKRPAGRPHLALCSWGRPWPSEFWPRDCLEKGHSLLETSGDILWTQQCCSGICSEKKKKKEVNMLCQPQRVKLRNVIFKFVMTSVSKKNGTRSLFVRHPYIFTKF